MTALAHAWCAWLCATFQGGGLPWPLAAGAQPFPLRATYGQIQGKTSAVDLHFGLDVLTDATVVEGDSVRAMEGGEVVAINKGSDYRSGLVIRSTAGRLLLYLHLDPSTIPFALGSVVPTGASLGTVTWMDPQALGRHVHVSVLSQVPPAWTGIDRMSSGDPRLLLETVGDVVAPVAVAFPDGRKLAVRTNEVSGSTYAANGKIKAGELDVIAHLRDLDRTGSTHPLAPASAELTVSEGGQVIETFTLDFDQPLDPWHNVEKAFYNRDSRHKSRAWRPLGEFEYYFVLTNARGTDVATDNAWHATPGSYKLRVRAWDAAGKELDFQEDLVVLP